ncbi:alpha-1-antitrypsin-like isoform X3 [Rana temporaria]|uniref:alpha-1-antitrypsin-like isoform X3 n=1 Tax=Rana temporaria TaxID=8407 RepID=UPI001AADBA40|nr:alpha-1-antitrypsin-like isoform X3 [Rana temporaria]
MRVLLYLSFGVALLCLVVFADRKGKKHDHKDDHEKKGDDHDPDHHRDNKQRSLADKILSVDKRKVGNKKLAFGLFSKVAADRPNENVVISPVSISTSLAFPSLGADGTTKDQITKGITMSETPKTKINHGFQNLQTTLNDENRELHLHSGNRLFVSRALKIKENFLNKAKNFGSEVFTVNLEENEGAKKQINDYVEKNTNGKIVDVLSNADKDAANIFVNFIYVRGQWEKPFDEKFTKEEDFLVNKDLAAKVPFMSQTGFYKVAELDEATVVSVPYKGNASALFILPKEGKMKEVESRQEDILTKYRSHCHRESIQLSIPKFSIDSTIDPEKPLHKLGIKTAFTDAADYSGKVEKVHHRVQITVDEEGTEAAGTAVLKDIPTEAQRKAKINVDEKKTEATEVDLLEAVPMKPPPPIALNRPFLLSIFDEKNKNILFRGKVVNPEK